eukprot:1138147-Pelagomonas_calceolata.AAC.1
MLSEPRAFTGLPIKGLPDYSAGGIWRWCCANLSSLPMSVLTRQAPQGLLQRALMIISLATSWRSVFMLEMI